MNSMNISLKDKASLWFVIGINMEPHASLKDEAQLLLLVRIKIKTFIFFKN